MLECGLDPAALASCADFGKKVKIELDGLSDAEIDAKVAEAVTIGDSMPRSPHQSGEKLQLPTVTE